MPDQPWRKSTHSGEGGCVEATNEFRRFTINGKRTGEGAQFSDGTIAIRWPADAGFEVFINLDALTEARPTSEITWLDEEADHA